MTSFPDKCNNGILRISKIPVKFSILVNFFEKASKFIGFAISGRFKN